MTFNPKKRYGKRKTWNLKTTVENQKEIRDINEILIEERDDIERNKQGGLAFKLSPEYKLFNKTISNFLFQPRFYGKEAGDQDLDGQDDYRETVDTIKDILNSKNHEFALQMADFLRNFAYNRDVPVLIMSLGVNYPLTHKLYPTYLPRILTRADQLLGFFNMVQEQNDKNTIPKKIKDAMEECLYIYNELQYYKYFNKTRTKGRTKLKDILRILHPKPRDEVYDALFRWAITGEVSDLLPKIQAIEKMKRKNGILDDESRELLKTSKVSWEFATKVFGMNKDVWNTMLYNHQLPYMASLRNIRNFLKRKADVNALCKYLTNENAVLNSKQYSFRFYNAHKIIKPLQEVKHEKTGKVYYNKKVPKILKALDKAITISLDNIPKFKGTTAIFSDNSASMSMGGELLDIGKIQRLDLPQNKIKREIQRNRDKYIQRPRTLPIEIASLMSVMAMRCSDDAIIGVFGQNFKEITNQLNQKKSIFLNTKIVKGTDVGHSTNAYKAIRWLTVTGTHVDRIMIFSDMQCYSEQDSPTSNIFEIDPYVRDSLFHEYLTYKHTVNKDVFLYSFDLTGYGTTQFPENTPNVVLLGGFTEKIFNFVNLFENSKIDPIQYIKQEMWKKGE